MNIIIYDCNNKETLRLLEDKIILKEKKEILLSDIILVSVIFEPHTVLCLKSNGTINIKTSNKKTYNVLYSHESAKNMKEVIEYLVDIKGIREDNHPEKKSLLKDRKEQIKNDIKLLPHSDTLYGVWKEVSELASILGEDEKIKAIASGLIDGATWLLVCTNKRIILMDKGFVYRLNLIEIPLYMVNSISCGKGLIMASIRITDGAKTRTITNVSSLVAKYFVETVYDEIKKYRELEVSSKSQMSNNLSIPDEIMKYKKLFDDGVITEDEFNKKKDELLNLK